MTINHIDQMHAWWQEANGGIPKAGDTIIADERHKGRGFYVYQATKDHPHGYDNIRVLHRAPAPKPAWHDAVAVMARCSNAPEDHREPFIRSEATHDVWAGEAGHARTGDLRDVTPLIEQKVTDEMVLAALNASTGLDLPHLTSFKRDEIEDMRLALTAALGLEAA